MLDDEHMRVLCVSKLIREIPGRRRRNNAEIDQSQVTPRGHDVRHMHVLVATRLTLAQMTLEKLNRPSIQNVACRDKSQYNQVLHNQQRSDARSNHVLKRIVNVPLRRDGNRSFDREVS
jgi:hypothetical protein